MNDNSGAGGIRYVGIEAAAGKIRAAEQLMVIGCSGGGKSTLSQKIAARFGLEYISIDRDIFWLPGWVAREKPEQHRRIVEFIAHDRWIMDGTNSSTFDIRVPRSDLVIWVRMPRYVNVWGILSRWVKYFGRTVRKWRPVARKRSTGNSSSSSGTGISISLRVSPPRLKRMLPIRLSWC